MRNIPIYVTRKNIDGEQATYGANVYSTVLILFLVQLNATLWGTLGVIEFFKVIL